MMFHATVTDKQHGLSNRIYTYDNHWARIVGAARQDNRTTHIHVILQPTHFELQCFRLVCTGKGSLCTSLVRRVEAQCFVGRKTNTTKTRKIARSQVQKYILIHIHIFVVSRRVPQRYTSWASRNTAKRWVGCALLHIPGAAASRPCSTIARSFSAAQLHVNATNFT